MTAEERREGRLRLKALEFALESIASSDPIADVITAAEVYLKFLIGPPTITLIDSRGV